MSKESVPHHHQEPFQEAHFAVGKLRITQTAVEIVDVNGGGKLLNDLVARHRAMNSASLSAEQTAQNWQALTEGGNITTPFSLLTGDTLYFTTIADRSQTIIQTAAEYFTSTT